MARLGWVPPLSQSGGVTRCRVTAQRVTHSQTMEQDSQRMVSKVWEGVWAGEGSATPRSDSGLNSLEYWDYSVELECITGQQGDTELSLPAIF